MGLVSRPLVQRGHSDNSFVPILPVTQQDKMVNVATEALAQESVWYEKFRYADAERQLFEQMAKGSSVSTNCSVVAEIIKAREQIKNSLTAGAPSSAPCVSAPVTSAVTERLQHLEKENADLKKITDDLRALVLSLDSRVKSLEGSKSTPSAPAQQAAVQAPEPAAKVEDEDDEEAERIKQERIAAYAAKNPKNLL